MRDPILAAVARAAAELESYRGVQADEQLTRDHGHLLTQLRPAVRYDSRERYFADSAATLVENRFDGGPMSAYRTRLLRADGSLIADADGALTLGFLRAGKYGDGSR